MEPNTMGGYPLADRIKSLTAEVRRTLVLRGILALALGIFILARPRESVAAFALVIAFWALIDGIVMAVNSFRVRPYAQHWWVALLGGIVGIAFGVLALMNYPGLSLAFAVVWCAVWLVTIGVLGTYIATRERHLGLKSGWTMAFGILAIITGALAAFYPGATLAALMGIIAAFGIVAGITMLVGASRIRSFERNAGDEINRIMGGGGATSGRTAQRDK